MSTEEVGEEEVLRMNAAQIFDLVEELQLDLAGCSNTEEFRERVLLHLRAQRGTLYDMQREFSGGAGEADSMRQALDSLLDRVHSVVTGLTPELEHALRTDSSGSEKTAPLLQQVHRRRRSLVNSDCSVIVAGETNAGKSTFLNLLLGLDVLPTSIFSCTAAVCLLRYSPVFRAQVDGSDGQRRSQDFPDAPSTKAWLDSVVAETNQDTREKGLDIHAIHVYLPATVLQCGVTLVDTPGIGENEAMTRCTMDYVKQNSAAAYLYIIKTDNAGGVHEDRLLDFLRAILQYNEERHSSDSFNPAAAMFVLNRWDKVPPAQRERVKDNALTKLRDVWPRFEAHQAFFLSSTNAQMHVDCDPRYVTDDYEHVLRGLKDIFQQARNNTVNLHYRWLKHFLHASTSFLQTAVHHCAMTDDQLMVRFKSTRARLKALEERTTSTTQQLRQHMQQAIQRLCGSMRKILQDEAVRKDLLDWSLQPLPPNPASFTTAEVQRWQEEVDRIIMKRIIDTVDNQICFLGLDQELHNSLKTLFQQELQLVDDDINSILSDMNDASSLASSMSSNSSCTSTDMEDEDAQELLRLYKERGRFRLGQLKHVSLVTHTLSTGSTSSEATMASVPRVVVGRLVARIFGPLATLGRTVQKMRRASLFNSNAEQYLKERTEKIVKVVCETEGCLQQMSAKYHEKMDSFIADVENSIPTFIVKNQQQMNDIRVNRRNYLSQRKELTALMEGLEPLRDMLRGFGALYIRDLTADNICFVLDAEHRRESVSVNVQNPGREDRVLGDSGFGESRLSQTQRTTGPWGLSAASSLWNSFRRGHVAIGSHKKDVMGRTYIKSPSDNSLIREIARLRCLRCEHLAPFLGMTRLNDVAIFLFLGDLRSARRFLYKGFHKPSESVPRLLEGVVGGLQYLHREGLVHMELSLDTVMVNVDGDPRLCGACLPRHARLPPDADHISADPFVCLSPEVLRDELYTSEDDVYSFGLLVWETCLQEKPYRQYRHSLSLQQFRAKVHPSSMLGMDACSHVSDTLAAILRGCLLPARGLRLKMEELKENVPQLRESHHFTADAVALREEEGEGDTDYSRLALDLEMDVF